MKYIVLSICAMFLITNNATAAKKKKVKNKTEKVTHILPTTDKSSLMLCNSTYGMPTWKLNFVNGFQFPLGFQAPANYRLVTINNVLLDEYLKTIPYEKSEMKINIPLFINKTLDCKEFTIERVVTMDSTLQAKYPNLMSFKIYDKTNQLNAGRVDCDDTSTKIMLTFNDEVYFVTPIMYNSKMYYACYSKNDPNFQKKSFERK